MDYETTFLDEVGIGSDYDARGLDDRMAAGGLIPPGKYRAVLHGANKTVSKAKNTPGWELTFRVQEGPFAGSDVKDTLYITDNPRSRDRLALFGSRLGLLVRNKDARFVMAEGKVDFRDCLDAPCIIETLHEEYDRDDGTKGKAVRLAFGGCFDPKDPKAIEALRAQESGAKPADVKATREKATPKKPSIEEQLANL